MICGYCIGLEYGENKKQTTPVNPNTIPNEVNEMFIVAFQGIYPLIERLIMDIVKVRKINAKEVSEKIEKINTMAVGILLTCYRLGVSTIVNESHGN